MTISDVAARALSASHWSPGRRVDITDQLEALELEGYELFASAVNFLREFSGLVIDLDDDEISISSTDAIAGITFERVNEDYSTRVNARLVPVGLANNMHLTLLIGDNNRWYGGFDNEFGLIGQDFMDAVEKLVLNQDFIQRM